MSGDSAGLEPGTVLARKFRVVRCLGEGGMGAVYEIEHELTKHRRALKLLHASMTQMPSVVERFLREASAAGRVGNPHIVESFDAGTLDSGEPYLVLEMLRGETLAQTISRGPMPLALMVDLIGQACDGIQAAHVVGIVHRDLKPDNLFVIEQDGAPFVKILDFGISKFDPSQTGGMALTQAGAALGTPYYMSPEQIRGEVSLDARADIYALGVILYECAASVRPFDAETLTHLAILIHGGQPKPLSALRPDLPPAFVDLVQRAMASDRDQRIQTAAELCAGLEQFGSVSFRSRGTGPRSMLPQSVVPARTLGTSAAGVSIRSATAATKPKSPVPLLVGLGLGAVALAGVLFVTLHHAAPAPSSSAESPVVPSAPIAAAAAPSAPVSAPPAAVSVVPPAPAASSAAPAVTPPIAVAPEVMRPADLSSNAAPNDSAHRAATPPATNAGPDHKSRRTDERGLAKDNPFR
jgi:serine/threonine protein kinase